jgi:hypothetical protein
MGVRKEDKLSRDIVLKSQIVSGYGHNKQKTFTRRQFRKKLDAERMAREEKEKMLKALKRWEERMARPYDE